MESIFQDEVIKQLQRYVHLREAEHIRRIVDIGVNRYYDRPKFVRSKLDNLNPLVAGVSSSIYYTITGDIKPIQRLTYGGLGARLHTTEEGLRFSENQLWMAEITNSALKEAKMRKMAGSFSIINGNALESSNNSGRALTGCTFLENACMRSKNYGDVAQRSKFYDNAFIGSENRGKIGFRSNFFDYAFIGSDNDSLVGLESNLCGKTSTFLSIPVPGLKR